MKKLLIIFFTLPLFLPVHAQNRPDSTHFLWFTGHWSKTKKNTFITTATTDSTETGVMKIAGGNTITVNSNGSVNISSKGIDDWNKRIDEGVKKIEQTEKKMKSLENQKQEWAYHLNQIVLPRLDTLKARATANKIEKKTDILNPDDEEAKKEQADQKVEEQAEQRLAKNLTNECNNFKARYKEIADFYNKHRREKDAALHNPPPPEFEFKCAACDSSGEKNYEKVCDAYVKKFFEPEAGMIKDLLTWMKKLQLIGMGEYEHDAQSGSLLEILEPLFSSRDKGACAYLYDEDMYKIVNWLGMHLWWRANKLVDENWKNYKVQVPVQRVYIEVARQNQLLGNDVNLEDDRHFCEMIYTARDHYYFDLVENHNWSQLANIPAIISLMRDYELACGGDDGDTKRMEKILSILNSFGLNIDMDVKAGNEKGNYTVHLKGNARVTPEFGYGKDTCYQWVVIEDKPDNLGQPVKKVSQKIEMDLLTNEMEVPQVLPTYIGTKKYYSILKQLKMNYCYPGEDTLLLTGFLPEGSTLWKIPHAPKPVPMGINGADNLFRDISKMEEISQSGEATTQAEQIKEQAEKMAAQMKTMARQMNGKRDASQIANYQKMINMSNQMKQLTSNATIAPLIYIDFPLQIQNNNYILFKKRFDAKEINPEISEAVEHGYFTVDIEYKGK